MIHSKRCIFLFLFFICAGQAFAFDVTVTRGSASVIKSGNTTIITTQGKAVLEGNTSISADESVRVINTGDVLFIDNALKPTDWQGQLWVEGKLVLINVSGIHISHTADIDVGSLIGATFDIEKDKFMAGQICLGQTNGYSPQPIINEAYVRTRNDPHPIFVAGWYNDHHSFVGGDPVMAPEQVTGGLVGSEDNNKGS